MKTLFVKLLKCHILVILAAIGTLISGFSSVSDSMEAAVGPPTVLQEIAESLQQVKHKGGSRPPIRTLGMGDVTGDCGIFATCNPFQGF